ncbi:unnamed protein product [Thlaspi arvense]|uniref:C2H2-type domain-containing protein n=1 Tax=Thlaspi arvense TaxID=13288 RepID=A0AAU9RMR8_THLAR|nr:unnamed protein product [Thlaspi arvense]
MEPAFMKDVEGKKLYQNVKDFHENGDYSKALEILDYLVLPHKEDRHLWLLHLDQGDQFRALAQKSKGTHMEIAYLLGALGSTSEKAETSGFCARVLFKLAQDLGSVSYYKNFLRKAKQGLYVPYPDLPSPTGTLREKLLDKDRKELESLIEKAEFALSKASSLAPKLWQSKKSPDPHPLKDEFSGLRSYWVGLDVKIKRDLMIVSIEKLTGFVDGVHESKGRDAFEKVLAFARENDKWTFWVCRTLCLKEFSSAEECKTHLEEEHAAGFKPSSEMDMVKRIGKNWAQKIMAGGWEPVDAVAAVEMIKNHLTDVKAFTSKSKRKGWSEEWPFAADEERSNVLKEINLLLVSLCDHNIFSGSIRDWLMRFPAEYLRRLEVSEQSLIDSHLLETPQSICFLELHDLNQIRDFLKKIKCERNDGTDLVCRAVDSLLDRTRVKEKIDFDSHYSFVLLDKRLLKSNNALFDDDGKINLIADPNIHYAKAQAQGDDIISWLCDYSSVDKSFPTPIREHNLDIWMAVLKAVQFIRTTLGTKYAKKKLVLDYEAALTVVENLCMSEANRRMRFPEDQWNSYASLLCDRCEEKVSDNSFNTKLFLGAVRDVFEGASHPTFDFPELEDSLNLIRKRKSLSDGLVLKSIDLLKSLVTHKVLLIDSKILLIDNSRIRLLNTLAELFVFDNRSYMLQFLKPFLLAQQITSTSMSSPLDKTVEHEPCVNLEPEEDSMEPEDTLARERGRLEDSSNTDIQVEATIVDGGYMQNVPGEASPSVNLESVLGGAAVRYNSALDMTLKALLYINVFKEDLKHNELPLHDDLETQVRCALQNLFTALKSDMIKTDGLYGVILSDLVAAQEVLSMSTDAAMVLVNILESWHCWKNSERESLVTRLFTLEENESMSCRKCGRKTNYPEQSYYGIFMAADSIRDLKCAFGDIVFVDILKMVRMEYNMLCDIKTGGCGKTNFVHHIMSRCPPIFTIVLEWEKSDTEKEISETTKALESEIDISRLYEGLKPNTIYRLVSMVKKKGLKCL